MKRIDAGFIEKYLFRGFDDSNEVFILLEAKDLARAKAESQDLRERTEEAGVAGKPDIYFMNSYSEAIAKASGF